MNRYPNKDVRMQLAEEVGFGCPVQGCGSPYLTWHHFDPPWKERQHHEPGGMIALCRPHHDQADVGTFTPEELREMQAKGRDRARALEGRFEWRRRGLLAVVGGAFHYETRVPVQLRDDPVVWFNRDTEGRVLLNIAMPSVGSEPRLAMEDNFWMETGDSVKAVECPPSGKLLSVTYANGDGLRIEFFEIADGEALSRRYRYSEGARQDLEAGGDFPLTAVEIRMRIVDPQHGPVLDFEAQQTRIGTSTIKGFFTRGAGVALRLR